MKTIYFQDKHLSNPQQNHSVWAFSYPLIHWGDYIFSLVSTKMVVFSSLADKNLHDQSSWVECPCGLKPLICCGGTERTSQSISDCCFNYIHSTCNIVLRLAYASHTCTMTRSNYTIFFRNNPKFMIYLVCSLRLSTFSFENAVFTSR